MTGPKSHPSDSLPGTRFGSQVTDMSIFDRSFWAAERVDTYFRHGKTFTLGARGGLGHSRYGTKLCSNSLGSLYFKAVFG